MPCPFFLPLRPLDRGAWLTPPRFPLGDPYFGLCHADPSAPHESPESHQRELCNHGYARGRCSHFPASAPADAVRFSLAGDDLIYALEKDHAPIAHGRLRFNAGAGPPGDELLIRQARAFLQATGVESR